ncbi:MAG TPA: hypothetical protein P5513_06450 [Candidatus Diapherotrites archaeon]|nr:hypothetical protein [Candidatus Diapherotrites archaeon]
MIKTWKRSTVRIKDTVTSDEQTAGVKNILIVSSTPVTETDDFIYNINIVRNGVDVTAKVKHSYNTTTGCVSVQTNSTNYVLTSGDVIYISGTFSS